MRDLILFINSPSSKDFNNGEYKQGPADLHRMAEVYTNPKLETIMSSPDNMKEANIGLYVIQSQVRV
jgi:hypothetical protein